MNQFLQKIDQFGAEEKLSIHSINPKQKSGFGGIMTIILYGASFAYFLNELIDWAQNNKLPKITSFQRSISQAETVDISGRYFEISYFSYRKGEEIDPFDPENIILIPIAQRLAGDQTLTEEIKLQFESVLSVNGMKKNTFYYEDLQLIGSLPNSQNYNDNIDFKIIISDCQQSLLPEGMKCATETLFKEYTDSEGYLQLTFYITQFDTKKRELYKIPKYFIKQISMSVTQSFQFSLDISNLQTDDGILFNNNHYYSYISNYGVEIEQIDQKYFDKEEHMILKFSLSQIKSQILIEYPKISEILADTGSIISWILQISFIVLKYNERLCSNKTIRKVIKIYFPDLQQLNIQKDYLGRYKCANIKDKQYDPLKVEKLIRQISQIALQKVNFINLQHEVSRLQLLFKQQLNLQEFKKCFTQVENIENLLDTCGYKIKNQESLQESVINFNNTSQLQLFDRINKDNCIEQNSQEFEIIESTIGLLIMPNENEIVKEQKIKLPVYPKEDLKPEDVSRLNSQH